MNHKILVKSLMKPGEDIALEMTGQEACLIHMALGIAGEAGEIVDTIKKHVIYHKPLNRANLVEELGDLCFYIEGLQQALGITRRQVLTHNVRKLTLRYGEKYSDDLAIMRWDKL